MNDRISTPIVFNVSPGVHGLRGVQKDHVQCGKGAPCLITNSIFLGLLLVNVIIDFPGG